jgi:hypothetical protein
MIVIAPSGNVAVDGCGVDDSGNWAYETLAKKTVVVGASIIIDKEKAITTGITDIFLGLNVYVILYYYI